MARKNEAADWLIRGYSIPEIAMKMGISPISVKLYLCTVVGEGKIQRSDIFFSISPNKRKAIEEIVGNSQEYQTWEIQKILENNGYVVCKEELDIFLMLREKDALLGDMYEYIRKIELTLHDMLKKVFVAEFGGDWWRKGVPLSIRKECVARKEEDEEPVKDPYCYTTFINLSVIIERNWKIFSLVLPPKLTINKKTLLKEFGKINNIRNRVMHPVKTRELTEEEFYFVHDFHKKIERSKWQPPPTNVNENTES
ncbi:MAG TPA: hypothetical protein HPP66_00865 [Planctomycetes bacterium]|nr:hypothetical protein [Planctomycetota bacterium]